MNEEQKEYLREKVTRYRAITAVLAGVSISIPPSLFLGSMAVSYQGYISLHDHSNITIAGLALGGITAISTMIMRRQQKRLEQILEKEQTISTDKVPEPRKYDGGRF